MSRSWMLVLALAAAVLWSTPGLAHQDKDKDKDHGKDHQMAAKDHDQDKDGWERREGYEYRTYGGNTRPPGWSKGKRTGWGDCALPTGDKRTCRVYTYNGKKHYWYRDDQGRIVVRREAEHDKH